LLQIYRRLREGALLFLMYNACLVCVQYILMTNDWLTLLTLTVFATGIVLSVIFLLLKRGIAIKLLGLYTVTLALGVAEPLMHIYSFSQKSITYYGGISFLYGPLLFLYVRYTCRREQVFAIKDMLHFIPASLYFLLIMIQPTNPAPVNKDVLGEVIIYELLACQVFIYMLKAISVFRRSVSNTGYDDVLRMKYTFIKNLIGFSAILFGSSFVFTHAFLFTRTFPIPGAFQAYIQLGFTFMILLIAFLNTEMSRLKRMMP
jgi:hypothetical protein